MREAEQKTNVAYMLRCCDGSLYTGWTNDIKRRLAAHSSGRGGKYTHSRLPVNLVYVEVCEDKHTAMRREWEIKQLSRAEKENLISGTGNQCSLFSEVVSAER